MIRRLLTLGLTLTTALAVCVSVATARSRDLVIHTRGSTGIPYRLGPWYVARDKTLGRAMFLFGRPTKVEHVRPQTSENYGDYYGKFVQCGNFGQLSEEPIYCCIATWASPRFRAEFEYNPDTAEYRRCGSHGRVDGFYTDDREWRTDRGLRVGDRTSRMRSLYPDAVFSGTGRWWLTTSLSLIAVPGRGRVSVLRAAFEDQSLG